MINGMNLAPISEMPPPLCADGFPSADGSCGCSPRFRGGLSHKIPRNGTVKASASGNITDVQCLSQTTVSWGGLHPTPADLQIRPYVIGGDAFIHIIDGRIGRVIDVVFVATNEIGNRSEHTLTLEVIA